MKHNHKMLGERIRDERIKRNITIEQLSELLNVTPTFVNLIERGQRGLSIEKLTLVADIFNVSTDFLLGYKYETNYEVSKFDELKALLHNFHNSDLEYVIDTVKLMRRYGAGNVKQGMFNNNTSNENTSI